MRRLSDDFDFPCSRTFRDGLPDLTVDYRVSRTFQPLPTKRLLRERSIGRSGDDWDARQGLLGWRSEAAYWEKRAVKAEEEVERLQGLLDKSKSAFRGVNLDGNS